MTSVDYKLKASTSRGVEREVLLTIVVFIFNYSHWIYFPLDVPMSSGVSNIRSKGNLLNCYEFEWDPNKGSEVYIIVSRNLVKDSVYNKLL